MPPALPPASPPSGVDKQAIKTWLSVVRAYHLCDAVMTARLAQLDLRTAEHELLANLARDPGISQQALAARCFTAKSHISTLLRSLEERGLVSREIDPGDARARRLFLTRAGEALARKTLALQAEVVKAMVRSVPAKDMAFIEDAMTQVCERLQVLQKSLDTSSSLPARSRSSRVT